MEDLKVIKSEEFAIRIVNLYRYLINEKSEFIMSKQVLRSGTSIGANIAESLCAESKDDFIHKLAIAQKEASETRYWLKLLFKTEYLNEAMYKSLVADCSSLLNILSSIIAKCRGKR